MSSYMDDQVPNADEGNEDFKNSADMNNNPTSSNDNPPNPVGQMADNAVQQGTKEVTKKVTKEAGKHVAKSAASSSLMASLSYVLMYVALAIVILFVIIGLIMFFVTMPGMVMDKIKALFKAMGNYVAAFFGADTTEQIDEVEVYETLDYLEQMGWDIKAEGFLSGYIEESSDITSDEKGKLNEDDRDWEIDEETGVVRFDDDKIGLARSDFIFTYIMSDNYVYTLKNDNIVTQKDDSGFLKNLLNAIATAWYKIKNFMFSPLFDALGITEGVMEGWGKGLIMMYYDTGDVRKNTKTC